jgi:hypothetical protein
VPRLEMLRAKKGDCLLLHYGTEEDPGLMLIDGGPGGVWNQYLKTRLTQLRTWDEDDRPTISLLMVSHIDDDHINGLIQLSNHLIGQLGSEDLLIDVERIWHNTFDDLFGDIGESLAAEAQAETTESSVERLASTSGMSDAGALVLLSVDQGRALRDNANALAWAVNSPFEGLVKGGEADSRVTLPDGPTLMVIGPTEEQLEQFHKAWDVELEKGKSALETAAYLDDSVYNLASIVALVEVEGRKVLLTGDARGDHIIDGADEAGLFGEGGQCRLDLLKVPHHGSSRTVAVDFFEKFPADNYVISGDGSHGNPTVDTFRMLFEARQDTNPFTIYLTYDPSQYKAHRAKRGHPPAPYPVEELLATFAREKEAGRVFDVVFPAPTEPSVSVDL